VNGQYEVIHAQDQRCSPSNPRQSSEYAAGGAELKISRSTRQKLLGPAHKAGLFLPLPDDLTEEALEEKLFHR
jgi:hypothetical protein